MVVCFGAELGTVAAFLGRRTGSYPELFYAMLMPLFAPALPADTINVLLGPCGWG
jgi:hypothetical protein